MVRPHSGSPRPKHRSLSDDYHSRMHHDDRFGPPSRSPRGFRGPPGKTSSWRGGHDCGRPPSFKRPPLMGERRDRPSGQWMSQNKDHYQGYPPPLDHQRGHRRPSPPRQNRPPSSQHRMSPQGPGHWGAPYHSHHSGRGAASSRPVHGLPNERFASPRHQSPYRGPSTRPSPVHEQEKGWGPNRHHSPRDRPLGRPAHGGQHWNGPSGFSHNGESSLSGSPQRKPREFHGRSSYPERWSAERDPKKQYGERGGAGHHRTEWEHRGNFHPRPYRSPSWKSSLPPHLFSAPSFSSGPRFPQPRYPPERQSGRPPKRSLDHGPHMSMGFPEHGSPKRFRREMSFRPPALRGFGGRALSIKDKSRLLKNRKFRAESIARLQGDPIRPRKLDKIPKPLKVDNPPSSQKDNLKKSVVKSEAHKASPKQSSSSADPKRDSESVSIQKGSRRSVSTHSSSPIEQRLSSDLVVVSKWQAGPRPSSPSPSPKNSAPWRDRAPKPKAESSQETLNERFSKLHDAASAREQRGHPEKIKRPVDGPKGFAVKPFRKFGTIQRPNFHPGPGPKRFPFDHPGNFRRPLMATSMPRPVFRKSQSIMSKYRNLQTVRQRGAYGRGPNAHW
ncbi:serine/arginine repetitive matrix protein 1 [Denticeps clupeoides]|uniref:Uncharacterized protein n=1 Tax=Denticeps clupeoides TaxID=299321 RepID=A0AAY4DNT2_9TELE|nr:serine/arginine repetitive matrix protein 1-like [Denticeps clupeoides]XP_028840792.1 serine/arginine repetitive matrix protein 1-like [Denticeps clupeoides]